MKWVLDDTFLSVPPQDGNGGKYLIPKGLFKEPNQVPLTAIDKTAAAVKVIVDDATLARNEKTARLRAARELRERESIK